LRGAGMLVLAFARAAVANVRFARQSRLTADVAPSPRWAKTRHDDRSLWAWNGSAFRGERLRLDWSPVAGQSTAGQKYLVPRVLSKFDQKSCWRQRQCFDISRNKRSANRAPLFGWTPTPDIAHQDGGRRRFTNTIADYLLHHATRPDKSPQPSCNSQHV
jgi:hypothetical protein